MTTDQDERSERRRREIDELHRVIGEFVVAFEQACHAMQICIMGILAGAGLRDQQVSQIILAGTTAEPLRNLFESLVGERLKLNAVERRIVKNCINRFKSLTEERNDIIHATWYIGWGNDETKDFSTASGMKFHKKKTGAAIKSLDRKAEDFSLLTTEANALANLFQRLNGCFLFNRSVERNFVVGQLGHVSVPPGSNG